MKTDDQAAQEQHEPGTSQAKPSSLPATREKFRGLILANPNYFGNIEASPFPPVVKLQLNTTYERLACVGFQPQFNRLDAVVYINQPNGYGGGVCSAGTPEYLRFYLSGDNGVTWQDVGLTSFTAYDIAAGTVGTRRLEYAVSLQINPRKRFCFLSNLYLVRAILSWNVPPPPNTPNFIPVWGNVHNTHIQIDPLKIFLVDDILQQAKLSLPPELAAIVDLSQPVAAAPVVPLSALELQALYKGTEVAPHRYALVELQQLLTQPALVEQLMAPGFMGVLSGLNLDLASVIGLLFPTDGSTVYEELECIGLNPNQDALVGVIRIKLPSGYSGGPCTAGSREYLTFWADFDHNGSFETCLGSTSVNVFDIGPIPREGLEYSVFLPVDLDKYRRPCQQGAVVVRIRAILSWQIPAPCWNPNFVPVWGNREHTLIHIKPGLIETGHVPLIETVGSMAVADINPAGYANGPAQLAGFSAKQSPFGGEVVVTGHLANPTDISNAALPLLYRVIVNNGSGDQLLTNTFTIARSQLLDGVWSFLPSVVQSVDAAGYYTYRADLVDGPGNATIFVVGNVLARWQTAGLSGTWQIRIEVKDPANVIYTGSTVTVRLDNQAPAFPAGSFKITTGGGSCADFTIGDLIEGTYQVSDEHFNSLDLSVQPALGGVFTAPTPLPRTYPLVPTTGEAGVWRLDTTGMPKCGYVIRLGASDRTIVNSGFIGYGNEISLGLCLKEKTP